MTPRESKISVLSDRIEYRASHPQGILMVRVFTMTEDPRLVAMLSRPDGSEAPLSLFLSEIESFVRDAIDRRSGRI